MRTQLAVVMVLATGLGGAACKRVTEGGGASNTATPSGASAGAGTRVYISPTFANVPFSGTNTLQFFSTGGCTPYKYSIDPGGISTVNDNGLYTRPWESKPTVVRVTDCAGQSAAAQLFLQTGGIRLGAGEGRITFSSDFGSLAKDAQGNLYFTGVTTSPNLGSQVGVASAPQYSEGYVAKLSPQGTKLWVRQFGGTGGFTEGYGIAVDSSGNVIVVGQTKGTGLGTQIGTAVAPALAEGFVGKFDTNGNKLWFKQIGGLDGSAVARDTWYLGVVTDSTGTIYTTGRTLAAIGTETGTAAANGMSSLILSRFDPDGTAVWHRRLGGGAGGDTQGLNIALATNGTSAFISGMTMSTPGTETGTAGLNAWQPFVARYDSINTTSPTKAWVKQNGGGAATTHTYGIAVDSANNVYLAGNTSSSILGTQLGTAVAPGLTEAFVGKYDASGNKVWFIQIGSAGGNTWGRQLVIDPNDNPYVSGLTASSSLGTQVGIGTAADAWVASLTPAGAKNWIKQASASTSGVFTVSGTVWTPTGIFVTGAVNAGTSSSLVELGYPSSGRTQMLLKFDLNAP